MKELVIKLFMQLVLRYVSVEDVKLATMGGEGLEAAIWTDLGIPFEHGWLVERSPKLARRLIKEHRFSIINQLSSLDIILRGHDADRAALDAFHLDLRGVLSHDAVRSFAPVIPLILSGTGRCLAVTVADQRRNVMLEQWPEYEKRARQLFGSAAVSIYERIVAQQRNVPIKEQPVNPRWPGKPFDVEKAAKREFGLLIELADLFRAQDMACMPMMIERYIYISRRNGTFRMRTYFFRFGDKTKKFSGSAFVNAWLGSKLFFGDDDKFHAVALPAIDTKSQPETKTKEKKMKYPKLLAFMEKAKALADEDVMREFAAVLEDGGKWQEMCDMVLEKVKVSEPPPTPTPSKPATKKARRSGKANVWEGLPEADKLKFKLDALEHKSAIGRKTWDAGGRDKFVRERLGSCNKAVSASTRAALARTSGPKFRPQFVKAIQRVFSPEEAGVMLDRLEKLG